MPEIDPIKVRPMKIHWKRVSIAGIWSELVLFAIYLIILQKYQHTGTMFYILSYLDFVVLMFLGGLWAARKIESRFILHGVLVGIIAQAVWIVLVIVTSLTGIAPDQILPGGNESRVFIFTKSFFSMLAVKVLASAAGGYVGGRRRKKLIFG